MVDEAGGKVGLADVPLHEGKVRDRNADNSIWCTYKRDGIW